MEIRHITPFSTSLNIGGEYNKCISELPNDCWVVLRDGDTMFLTPDWGKQIEEIITANPDYDLITCMTNRIGVADLCVPGMFGETDIQKHVDKATLIKAWDWDNRFKVEPTFLAPGMLMIFHKSVWVKAGGFEENTIFFDKRFSKAVSNYGGKIGVAKGLYLFHLYRWGQDKPKEYREHLIK